MERVWGHVFTHTITLSEANQNTWFNKLTDLIQRTQQQQLWVSETKVRTDVLIMVEGKQLTIFFRLSSGCCILKSLKMYTSLHQFLVEN